MTNPASNPSDRTLDLLAQAATEGISDAQRQELEDALRGQTDALVADFERAAAAIDLALCPSSHEPMPAALRERILTQASAGRPPGERGAHAARANPGRERFGLRLSGRSSTSAGSLPRMGPAWRWSGWVAAAACLILGGGVGLWSIGEVSKTQRKLAASEQRERDLGSQIQTLTAAQSADREELAMLRREVGEAVQRADAAEARAAEMELAFGAEAMAARAALLARGGDVVVVSWKGTDDPLARGCDGDVVWSDADQRGYMRFKGLAKNEPTREQYQLWIFDAARDDAEPVDGGVFDVGDASVDPETGDVVVQIDAKLRVAHAKLFAVTVEATGGVVKSKRERIAVLGARAG